LGRGVPERIVRRLLAPPHFLALPNWSLNVGNPLRQANLMP